MEQPYEMLMEAMRRHHDSLAEQLQQLDARVQQIAESLCQGRRGALSRRGSTHSNNSAAVEHPATQKRLQADSLAMEVLQMDISHLGVGHLPTRSMSLKKLPGIIRRQQRAHSTNSTPKKEKEVDFSILPSSPALPGFLEQGPVPREATQSVTEETDGLHRSIGASTGLPSGSCSRDQEDSRGRFVPQESRSLSREDGQLIPRSSTSGNKTFHRGGSQSSAFEAAEPQEDAKSLKSMHRGGSLGSGFLAEVAESQEDGKSSRGENTPKESSKKTRAVSIVSSGGKEREKTRRASAVLDRAVSKGNLSEVFRLREQELTAALSHRPSNDPQTPSAKSREKTTMLQELTNEDGGTSELSADEVEIGHEKSCWLRFGRLNTWVSVHASKALGLVPLFDDLESAGWISRCRKVASRLYHWLLVAFLIYGIVNRAIELSICPGEDQDEACSAYWPPLAVDMLLLVGAVMVMCSRGGFLNYSGNTRIVAQSVQELAATGLRSSLKVASLFAERQAGTTLASLCLGLGGGVCGQTSFSFPAADDVLGSAHPRSPVADHARRLADARGVLAYLRTECAVPHLDGSQQRISNFPTQQSPRPEHARVLREYEEEKEAKKEEKKAAKKKKAAEEKKAAKKATRKEHSRRAPREAAKNKKASKRREEKATAKASGSGRAKAPRLGEAAGSEVSADATAYRDKHGPLSNERGLQQGLDFNGPLERGPSPSGSEAE
eukprot:s568_g24.t1